MKRDGHTYVPRYVVLRLIPARVRGTAAPRLGCREAVLDPRAVAVAAIANLHLCAPRRLQEAGHDTIDTKSTTPDIHMIPMRTRVAGVEIAMGEAIMSTALVGYLAASLVFATFCTKRMVPLRALAIISNIAFITYGWLGGLWPILILHAAMLPLNIHRLRQEVSLERPGDTGGAPAGAGREVVA